MITYLQGIKFDDKIFILRVAFEQNMKRWSFTVLMLGGENSCSQYSAEIVVASAKSESRYRYSTSIHILLYAVINILISLFNGKRIFISLLFAPLIKHFLIYLEKFTVVTCVLSISAQWTRHWRKISALLYQACAYFN